MEYKYEENLVDEEKTQFLLAYEQLETASFNYQSALNELKNLQEHVEVMRLRVCEYQEIVEKELEQLKTVAPIGTKWNNQARGIKGS